MSHLAMSSPLSSAGLFPRSKAFFRALSLLLVLIASESFYVNQTAFLPQAHAMTTPRAAAASKLGRAVPSKIKKRLTKAIEQFTAANASNEAGGNGGTPSTIEVNWKPFMIDPATNINGETVPDYCQRRWGGGGWTKNLKVQGRKDGASFNNWQWWPHTLKAHQLVHYCETKHLPTNKCNALLFDAEYEQGLNLADVEVLMDVASKMEITELDELKKYLTEDEGAAEVNRAIALGRRDYEISSVPFFVIGKVDADGNPSRKPYGFSGAQGPETFLGIFEKLSSSETA